MPPASTVPEVIVARARGIKVAGISCITNHATGISTDQLSHGDGNCQSLCVKPEFQRLLRALIPRMDGLV
ncbi:MAG: hypothetical protein R3C26_21755 [Calditrichia bacterium]